MDPSNDPLLVGTDAEQRDVGHHKHSVQNGIAQTVLLVVANLAGAGILSLPKAIVGAGLVAGICLVVCSAILSAYTADILCRCYDIIGQRELARARTRTKPARNACKDDSDERKGAGGEILTRNTYEHGGETGENGRPRVASFFARSPYAAIGQEAAGTAGAAAVTLAQFATQFSVMVVFLLISGTNLNKLVPTHTPTFFSLTCTASLTPLMLLRPGHVWATALLAIVATLILVVVILFLCATNAPHAKYPYETPPAATFSSIGTAFGVILFGYGGHAILPALQATMKDPSPSRFRQAIGWSFLVVTGMYISTSVASVLTLGGAVGGDVLTNFDTGVANTFGLAAVTAHLLFAAVTVHIPVGQILDHYAGATDLSLRQVCIRACTMGLVGAVVYAAGDHFFCVIGLVGGTCSNAMIFIFPPWFYLRLVDTKQCTTTLVISMGCIILIGVAGAVAALIGAVKSCE